MLQTFYSLQIRINYRQSFSVIGLYMMQPLTLEAQGMKTHQHYFLLCSIQFPLLPRRTAHRGSRFSTEMRLIRRVMQLPEGGKITSRAKLHR